MFRAMKLALLCHQDWPLRQHPFFIYVNACMAPVISIGSESAFVWIFEFAEGDRPYGIILFLHNSVHLTFILSVSITNRSTR